MSGESGSPGRAPGVGIVLPGALPALGLIGYFTTRPDLETLRPEASGYRTPGPPTPPGISAVHARLWEDPLEAAYRDTNRQSGEPGWTPLLKAFISIEPPGGPRLKKAQAVVRKILEDHRYGSSDTVKKANLDEVPRIFRAIVDRYTSKEAKGKQRFLCMPVLLPGGAIRQLLQDSR